MANSVDPDQTAGSTLLATILNSSVILGNYLQQTASADNILDAFFLGALRVKISALKKDLALFNGNLLTSKCFLFGKVDDTRVIQ